METDKMSTASSVGASERRPLLQALIIERRILFGGTILVGLSTFVWIAAVCTAHWVHIEGDHELLLREPTRYFIYADSSLWEICRMVFMPATPVRLPASNDTSTTTTTTTQAPARIEQMKGNYTERCLNFLLQPKYNAKGTLVDPAYDPDVANYVRTMISFGIITIFVMAMGCGFSIYTFMNPRYMFKRLAGGIHFISTSCTFVVMQVMMSTVDHWKKTSKVCYPPGAYHYYHISFYMGWFVVMVNVFAAVSFLWYSKKRKGDKAATDELAMADEPTIIGR